MTWRAEGWARRLAVSSAENAMTKTRVMARILRRLWSSVSRLSTKDRRPETADAYRTYQRPEIENAMFPSAKPAKGVSSAER